MMKEKYVNVIRDTLIFFFSVFLLTLTWENNFLATLIIITIFLIRNYFWHIKGDYALYVVGAIFGPGAEIVATWIGIWQYAYPTFLNLPLWLPFAWGFMAVVFMRVAQNFMLE